MAAARPAGGAVHDHPPAGRTIAAPSTSETTQMMSAARCAVTRSIPRRPSSPARSGAGEPQATTLRRSTSTVCVAPSATEPDPLLACIQRAASHRPSACAAVPLPGAHRRRRTKAAAPIGADTSEAALWTASSAHARERLPRSRATQQEGVEPRVRGEVRRREERQGPRAAHDDGREARGERRDAHEVAAPQVEPGRRSAASQHHGGPRGTAMHDVGDHHGAQAPVLEMGAQDARLEPDARPGGREPQAELDVLDRRDREALVVVAADLHEGLTPHGAQAGPEGRRGAGRAVVHVVVEHVAERRDRAVLRRTVVVGPEDGGEPGVRGHRGTDAADRVGVHDHVGVHEDQERAAGDGGADVARARRPEAGRAVDHDDLVGRIGGGPAGPPRSGRGSPDGPSPGSRRSATAGRRPPRLRRRHCG